VAVYNIFIFALFLVTFWNSIPTQAALIYVASSMVVFFCVNPYLLTLTDWRNFMSEEADALLHSSKTNTKVMKCVLTLMLCFLNTLIEYGCVNCVVDDFESSSFFVGMLGEVLSFVSPFIFFGLYTKLPFESVQIFSLLPFIFMIFFSTTFSPGSGVNGLKELRYLFVRFYLFCRLPGVQDQMEVSR
jgi:hypothetical protein